MSGDNATVTIIGTERSDSQWKQLGFKKFDDAMVRTTHGQERVAVRFDKHSGTFGASVRDQTFESKDFKALIKAMSEYLKARESLTFQRYIAVMYERRGESTRGRRYGSKSWRGNNIDESDPEAVVAGIYLEFDVWDVSNEFSTAVYGRGRDGSTNVRVWRRMERDNETGEWRQATDDETVERGLEDLIPFTLERYEALMELKRGITRIDSVLNGMFNDKALASGASALLLDKFDGPKLLGAGAPEPKKKAKKR